jgi:four helix bundle protein
LSTYKFQKLEVYKLALSYIKDIYVLTDHLPQREHYNLASQIQRAATSIALNIAEGSTGQSNPEQQRFLSMALRSYLETIACMDLIEQCNYVQTQDITLLRSRGHQLFIKLTAFKKALR